MLNAKCYNIVMELILSTKGYISWNSYGHTLMAVLLDMMDT
jgi:hypothetical protein